MGSLTPLPEVVGLPCTSGVVLSLWVSLTLLPQHCRVWEKRMQRTRASDQTRCISPSPQGARGSANG